MPHTPGPWLCETVLDGEVFHISAASRYGCVPIAMVEFGFNGPIEIEQQANAPLITAAPLMLAALEAIIEPWSSFSDHDLSLYYRPILNARAAIKAVRGE